MAGDKQYKVEFRSCDIHWAANHSHLTDFTELWDQVPWNEKLTEAITTDYRSAYDQFMTLRGWWRDKSQPVKDVQFSISTAGWVYIHKDDLPLPSDQENW